jgi:hypothetical protein
MFRSACAALIATAALAPAAQAAECGVVLDELAKAISGHLTMAPEKKASMLRVAMSGYDSCMAGDSTSSAATRDMIMKQIKASLGGN